MAQQWPLLGISNKFIYEKYQIYWVSLILGIINIGYQKYWVSEISGSISDISEIYWVSEISVIRNIGYQKYQISEISGIRNIRYLLISIFSYQSSIIEKMSELPVTNLHIAISVSNQRFFFELTPSRQVKLLHRKISPVSDDLQKWFTPQNFPFEERINLRVVSTT